MTDIMEHGPHSQKDFGNVLFEYDYIYSMEHLIRLNRELNKLRKKRKGLYALILVLFVLAEVCFYFAGDPFLMIVTLGLIVFFYPLRNQIEKRKLVSMYNGNAILKEAEISIKFYDECFTQTHEKGYMEFKYSDAIRVSETQNDLFILFSERNVIDIYKEKMPAGLDEFLKSKISTKTGIK